MNLLLLELMDKPSLLPGYCVVCGAPYPTGHHPVSRGQGGHDGPQLHLCGHGTAGCHGEAEDKRLHFRWSDAGWLWLRTERPLKYDRALLLDGWQACGAPPSRTGLTVTKT